MRKSGSNAMFAAERVSARFVRGPAMAGSVLTARGRGIARSVRGRGRGGRGGRSRRIAVCATFALLCNRSESTQNSEVTIPARVAEGAGTKGATVACGSGVQICTQLGCTIETFA